MNLSAPFIARPVATTLLTLGIALAGSVAYFLLPVSPLPQVDFPTVSISASMAGASPETMATSVATPLERHLGQIADVTEMTSNSSQGSTRITLQFGLNRDIDGAARDVQAAINAARADLPTSLKSNPTYRKVNPADAPIMIIALTSKTLSQGQIYDAAATVLQQKISQLPGVGQVTVGGSSLPAVRVELNPRTLYKYGIGFDEVRSAISAANANSPKGSIEANGQRFQIYTNDQIRKAEEYKHLVIATRNGTAVRLSDVAEVVDSVEDLRNQGLTNGEPSVALIVSRQPNANIIATIDGVNALLPQLAASVSSAINMKVVMDNSTTIRASLHDIQNTLLISIGLVIFVVFIFLGSFRAALIPSVAVPVSLVGTFGVMYLLGFSLNNLSLMALIVSTGFVVDDAIVVLENASRHIENGMSRTKAALQGAKEVGFTVLSMSISLVAVFIPLLLMGGIIGRLFREFAITLSVAVMISLVISLTTTPMMCAYVLQRAKDKNRSVPNFVLWFERGFQRVQNWYVDSLEWSLNHRRVIMLILAAAVGLNVYLFAIVPKGFFPQQDTGRIQGGIRADQSTSFQAMREKLAAFVNIVKADPAVANVVGYTGGGQTNGGFMFVSLKPLAERKTPADVVINRLRPKFADVPGATLFLQASQDIRMGGRSANAQYQYTLQGDNLEDLREWSPKLRTALQSVPEVTDVDSDQQDGGLEIALTFDRATMARLQISAKEVDNALYDAFGQRQVSTIYNPLNQYHVIMEVAPEYWQSPETLNEVYVSTKGNANGLAGSVSNAAGGTTDTSQTASTTGGSGTGSPTSGVSLNSSANTMVPLSAFASFAPEKTPLGVSHQGHFVATTIAFNLAPGKSLSDAVTAISDTMNRIGVPATVHGSFQGTAKLYQESLNNQPILILAALIAVYIVLGVLYESTIHPITILSTLPSAGVGAVLALLICKTEFSIIALIGVILLIGIVKKNAIMMIDFALEAERTHGLDTRASIIQACTLRFRPIMMTTLAAMLGALPLALGFGDGAEMRRPLGISIVGGLLVSQMLTLYTTPVIYLYLDRLRFRHKKTKSVVYQPEGLS
jgi:multidrug efflux pump